MEGSFLITGSKGRMHPTLTHNSLQGHRAWGGQRKSLVLGEGTVPHFAHQDPGPGIPIILRSQGCMVVCPGAGLGGEGCPRFPSP